MKKSIIVLFTIFLTIQSYSQKTLSSDYAYKVSDPYKVFDAKEKLYFSKNNEVMAIKLDGKEVLIQKFDATKPAFKSEHLYEKYFPKNYQVEAVLEVNSKYYLFYSSWDGDNEKEQLFSVEIDFAKGEFVGEQKLMFQVDGKVTGSPMGMAGGMGFGGGFMFSMGVQDKFSFMQSNDKKSFLVQYRKKPEVKRDTKSFDIIGLNTFNGNLTKTSGNEVTMPYTERRMNNLDYQLDNKGNLFLLAKVFHDDSNDDKKHKKDTIANYHIELFKMKPNSTKIDITKFENKDKFINKLWLFDTDKDFLLCGGYYSNGKGHFDDIDGTVSFKVKQDGTVYDKTFHEIPTEVINQYESEKTKRKNEKKERKGEGAQFSDLVLKELVLAEDGSMVLIGEQDFMIYHFRSGGMGMGGMGMGGFGGGNGYYTYHYCDILATKINADGSLGWMKKITKNQVGARGQGGMSYKYFNANDSHYFVFLDNVKNIDLPIDKEPKQHSDGQGGYLTAVKIVDNNGDLKKGSILNAREVEDFQIYQFATNRIVKTSENTFVLEVYKKKKEDVMIKVELK